MARSQFDKQVDKAAGIVALGIGRFLAGRDVDGVRRTDATFLRPGRYVSSKAQGRVSRGSYRAGWQRLVIRIGLMSAGVSTSYAYHLHPQATLQVLEYGGGAAAVLAAAGGLTHTYLHRQQRELMREWIKPLHQALTVPLGIPEQTDPRRYLHIPHNFNDDDARIRIDVPNHLRFKEEQVVDIVVKKLALENVSFAWHRAGRDTYVTVKKKLLPPKKLHLSDPGIRELLESMPELAPLIGLGAGSRKVSVDLDDDSPHVLISAGSGGGKTTILRCIACQFVRNGAQAWILDYKRISHAWARGVPGVTYRRDIADIHDALIYLGQEGRRRIRLAEELGDDVLDTEPWRVGPRLVILLEEINSTTKQLIRHWEKTREKSDPRVSPAIDALAEILFMGRQTRIHVLLVAQSATARAIGGPEMRENFSTRILVRYTLNAWRMLVPEVSPIPKSTTHPGRAQVVLGGIAQETQVLNISNAEAREWAMSSPTPKNLAPRGPAVPGPRVEPPPTMLQKTLTAPTDGDATLTIPGGDTNVPSATPTASDSLPVGLRQAQEQHLPDITLAALRWARANDPDFPPPAGQRGAELLYHLTDLKRWARNRPRGGTPTADHAP